jgi:hypothetical protein
MNWRETVSIKLLRVRNGDGNGHLRAPHCRDSTNAVRLKVA